tara:strand:- start:1118 stop:1567 length:450 start_codon:yes stop_codon:yes gene_type:complete
MYGYQNNLYTYHQQLSKDRLLGGQTELDLLETIKNTFGMDIKKTTGMFAKYDFYDDFTRIELKTMRNPILKYHKTIIGQNKIDYLLKRSRSKNCYILYKYPEGLYKIKIDKDNSYKLEQNMTGGRKDRGINEIKRGGYCYINIKYLEKI